MKDGMDNISRKLISSRITPITISVVGVILLILIVFSVYYYYDLNYVSTATINSESIVVQDLHNSMFKIVLSIIPSTVLAIIALVGLYLTYHSIQSSKSSSRKQLTIQLVTDINDNKRLQNTKNLIFLKGNDLPQYYGQLNDHKSKKILEEKTEKDVRKNKDRYVGNKLIKFNVGILKNGKKVENEVKEAKDKIRDSILQDEKLKDDIHYVLNYYEHIALGIRVEAFEEEIFKNLHYSNFMKIWHCAHPLILQIRSISGKDTIYQEIEYLARKWKNEPIERHALRIEIVNGK